jgi:hypothetical protein
MDGWFLGIEEFGIMGLRGRNFQGEKSINSYFSIPKIQYRHSLIPLTPP